MGKGGLEVGYKSRESPMYEADADMNHKASKSNGLEKKINVKLISILTEVRVQRDVRETVWSRGKLYSPLPQFRLHWWPSEGPAGPQTRGEGKRGGGWGAN